MKRLVLFNIGLLLLLAIAALLGLQTLHQAGTLLRSLGGLNLVIGLAFIFRLPTPFGDTASWDPVIRSESVEALVDHPGAHTVQSSNRFLIAAFLIGIFDFGMAQLLQILDSWLRAIVG